MLNLLKTEWLKIKGYPAFWWMLGIVAFAYPGMNYAFYYNGYLDQLNSDKMGPILRMLPNPFTFPSAWHTVAAISSLFVFLPSIVVIMFITNEYSFKTHRQNIIDGWSRKQFMLSKMIDVFIITVIITALYATSAYVIGTLNAGEGTGSSWQGSKYIGLFFLQQFSQLSLALLIALLVRKAFVALGIFLVYFFPTEPILNQFLKIKANDIGEFLPLEVSDRLIPVPRWFVGEDSEWKRLLAQSDAHIWYTLLFLAITWGVCFWINTKRDL